MDGGSVGVRASLDSNQTRGYGTGMPKLRGNAVSNPLVGGGVAALGLKTPRGNSMAAMYDSAPAFKIDAGSGIPGKGSIRDIARNKDRLQTLMSLPMHKTGTAKFDGDPTKRTLAPLTKEDTGNFGNHALMSTLRAGKGVSSTEEGQQRASTIDNPPSFYDDDMNKWRNKFAKAVSSRAQFKKQHFSKDNKSILATNDNFVAKDPDLKIAEPKYTGGSVQPTKSEFKKVIGRRKSRQSVNSPTNCDIDFVGNSAAFHHIIKGRNASKEDLNFNMNLRCYKNSTRFNGSDPWQFPAPKAFAPTNQFTDTQVTLDNR